LIIAHRGGALEAAENSMSALRKAAALSVDGIEVDVRATGDGLVVLHHDEHVKLPSGRSVPLSSMSAEEFVLAHPEVPTLAATLSVRGRHLWLLELKPTRDTEALLAGLRLVLQSMRPPAMLASFSAELLSKAAEAVPGLPLVAVVKAAEDLESFRGLNLRAVAASKDCALEIPRRLEVWAWTARTAEEGLSLATRGVKGIITDVPRATLELCNQIAAQSG
jgi:glycerophosphoryl diester phosphodiesterase